MGMPGDLTLEQELEIQILREQVKGLTVAQAQEYIIDIMQLMMMRENLVKHLIKHP